MVAVRWRQEFRGPRFRVTIPSSYCDHVDFKGLALLCRHNISLAKHLDVLLLHPIVEAKGYSSREFCNHSHLSQRPSRHATGNRGIKMAECSPE
jgi:hypothetical protein